MFNDSISGSGIYFNNEPINKEDYLKSFYKNKRKIIEKYLPKFDY